MIDILDIPPHEALELQTRLIEASSYWEYELVTQLCADRLVKGVRATFKPDVRASYFFCRATTVTYFVTGSVKEAAMPARRISNPVEFLRQRRDELCQGRYR